MFNRTLSAVTSCVFLALGVSVSAAQTSQAYPSKVVRIIVPFSPGTALDIVARHTADYMKEKTGGTFIVENRAGAGGLIGAEYVARAPADGYTLLIIGQSLITAKELNKTLRFEPLVDLVPVAQIGDYEIVLSTNAKVGVKTFQEFLALSKAKPGVLNYGTAGRGSATTLVVELLKMNTGLDLTEIMYKGTGELVTALLQNDIQFSLNTTSQIAQHSQNGTLQPLIVVSNKRLETMPDVPTLAEVGYEGFVPVVWGMMMAPKGTPEPIINELASLIAAMAKDPNHRKKVLDSVGINLTGIGPEETRKRQLLEVDIWRKVIEAARIEPQ